MDADQAALDAVDPDRLLEGEDPATDDLAEALHWVQVYQELCGFKRQVIAKTVDEASGLTTEAAGKEVGETDLPILTAEGRRLRARLEFWEDRVHKLRTGS